MMKLILAPAWARAYEPPSICSRESAALVLLLMSIDKPSPRKLLIRWKQQLNGSKIRKLNGIRVEEFNAPEFQTPLRTLKTDRRVVEDKSAPPIWARFYELGTRKPLFSNRKSEMLYSLADVDRERRTLRLVHLRPADSFGPVPRLAEKMDRCPKIKIWNLIFKIG